MTKRVTLIGRDGCHLCDAARAVVAGVCEEQGVGWSEVDIDSDDDLLAQFGERIPVVLVDGEPWDFWRIDADRLRLRLRSD